jgi:hypothetical protein
MYSGFLALKATNTLWIYFFEPDEVSSGGSFEIFQMVMSSIQLIENVMTHSSPYSSSLAGFGGAPVFGSLGLQYTITSNK